MDKKQPGVMLYSDIRPCLNRMSRQEQGELFVAILDYAQYGVVPELDGLLGVAWDFIQPRLDRDREKYGQTVSKRKYAAYVRDEKNQGNTPLSFDDWKAQEGSCDISDDQVMSCDVMCHPTTTPNTNTNTSTSPSTTTAPTATTTSASTATPTGCSRDEFEQLRRQRMEMLMSHGTKEEG